MCLADKTATTIPPTTEKEILHNAGLGAKQIWPEASDEETKVLETLMSDDGFPKLKRCRHTFLCVLLVPLT
jgi:hypothetical protein